MFKPSFSMESDHFQLRLSTVSSSTAGEDHSEETAFRAATGRRMPYCDLGGSDSPYSRLRKHR